MSRRLVGDRVCADVAGSGRGSERSLKHSIRQIRHQRDLFRIFRQRGSSCTRSRCRRLCLGLDTSIEREAGNRENSDTPDTRMQLLNRVRQTGRPTVVVLLNGGIVGAEELIVHTDGILEAFYPGVFGTQAVSNVLFGDAVPSGKLPVTMYPCEYVQKWT